MDIQMLFEALGPLIFSWPIAAVVIALIFRKPVNEALSGLKRLKIGNNEIERFDKAIKQSEQVVDEMEQLQVLLAEAALSEMRAVDESPYAPEAHKPIIKQKADALAEHLQKLKEKQRARNASS